MRRKPLRLIGLTAVMLLTSWLVPGRQTLATTTCDFFQGKTCSGDQNTTIFPCYGCNGACNCLSGHWACGCLEW